MGTFSNLVPEIGMGVTIEYYSDRSPGTIIQINRNGKEIIIQEDLYNRIDNNGMSECQKYEYLPNPQGEIHVASKRKDGTYRLVKQRTIVRIGYREKYHDYSF